MKAVILAGGLGSRLKPFTEVIPKPLLPIGEKSVLEIQIGLLKKYGFKDIFLCTNYKSDYIEKFLGDGQDYDVNLVISKEKNPLGTVGPLSLIKEQLDEPFLIINGDILTLLNFRHLYNFALKNSSSLTVSIIKHVMPFAFGDILFKGDFITSIKEKPEIEKYIIAGIYIMQPEIFSYIPFNSYFNMDELIIKMLKEKDPIDKYEINDYWLDIGRIEDYKKAQIDYKSLFKTK